MSIRRIMGLSIQYSRAIWAKRSEVLYYAVFDVVFFSFFGIAMGTLMGTTSYSVAIVIAAITARPVVRGALNMGRSVTDNTIGKNLVPTFATPVCLVETVIASALVSMVTALICVAMSTGLVIAFLRYDYRTLLIVITLLPSLIVSSIVLGIVMITFAYALGRHSIAWQQLIGWGVLMVGGIWVPAAALPGILRVVAQGISFTYIFDGLRAYIMCGASLTPYLLTSAMLDLCYALLAIGALYYTFKRAKYVGLGNLENK